MNGGSHMKKITVLILALLMLCTIFASCRKKKDEDPEKTDSGSEAASTQEYDSWGRKMIYSPLDENLKYNKETVTFLVRDVPVCKGQFESTEESTDRINEAVFNRNLYVQDRLNIKLEFEYAEQGVGNSEYNNRIVQMVMSGLHDYDIASTFAYYSSAMLYSGYYYNLLEVGNLYLDQPYWNQSYINEAELYNQLYLAVGDMSLTAIQNTFCIFFNSTQFDNHYKGVDLYDVVREGEWTAEYFKKLVKDIYTDSNTNGRFDEKDSYGLITTLHSFSVDAFFAANNLKICEKDSDGIPQLVLNSEKTVKAFEDTYSLLFETRGVYATAADDEGVKAAREAFVAGRSLFSVDMLRTGAYYSQNMTDKFGVLPLYKMDDSQAEYSTTVQDSYDALAILGNVGDERAEMLGAVLEIMCYRSYLTVRPEYFETVTKKMYSSGYDDAEMYDKIIDTVYFDYGMINSYAISRPNIGHLWRTLLINGTYNFVGAYNSNATVYSDGLKAYIKYFSEIGE